jgi:hypothetical protein
LRSLVKSVEDIPFFCCIFLLESENLIANKTAPAITKGCSDVLP